MHDASVLDHSSLYNLGVDNKLLSNIKRAIECTKIPLYLIEDFSYSLLTWPVKPFPHNDSLSVEQRKYNCGAKEV